MCFLHLDLLVLLTSKAEQCALQEDVKKKTISVRDNWMSGLLPFCGTELLACAHAFCFLLTSVWLV